MDLGEAINNSCYRYHRSQKQRAWGLNPGSATLELCDLEQVNV